MGPFLFDLEAPDAPPILTGMIPAENQVIFNWSIPSDPGGSGIDSYDCQIGTIAGSSNVFNGNVRANPYKIASHIPSGKTSYYARVRAVDVAGNVGPWSANSSPVAANAAPTDLKSATIAHILGRATLDTELRFHAELNGDGQISIEDLILLINDGL